MPPAVMAVETTTPVCGERVCVVLMVCSSIGWVTRRGHHRRGEAGAHEGRSLNGRPGHLPLHRRCSPAHAPREAAERPRSLVGLTVAPPLGNSGDEERGTDARAGASPSATVAA